MTNMVTIRLALGGDYRAACWFVLGIMVAEVIYAKVSSALVKQMFRFALIVRILQWIVLAILVVMATLSLLASAKGSVQRHSDVISGDLSPFVLGFLLMAINPVQIPFWIGWATILSEKRIFDFSRNGQLGYLTGVALGSLLASAIFIASGQFLSSVLSMNERLLHLIFGCVFVVMSLMQARKLFRGGRRVLKREGNVKT